MESKRGTTQGERIKNYNQLIYIWVVINNFVDTLLKHKSYFVKIIKNIMNLLQQVAHRNETHQILF